MAEKIAVYGTGIEGERFYCKYKETYEIAFYIDEIGNKKFHGYHVYSTEEVFEIIKDYFVVIATGRDHYNELAKKLIERGS